MQKEEKNSEIQEIEYLNQLINTLEETVRRLEYFYVKKDYANFEKIKKFILNLFNKISEITNK